MSRFVIKKKTKRRKGRGERDTMRPEYDFSRAVRGATAARYQEGVNIAVIDPDLVDVFPDSAKVNQTLRARAPILREQRRSASENNGS